MLKHILLLLVCLLFSSPVQAEEVCAHTGRVEEKVFRSNVQLCQSVTPYTHRIIADKTYKLFCYDCEETIETLRTEYAADEVALHHFTSDGVCNRCGQKADGCLHKAIRYEQEENNARDFVPIDAHDHRYTYDVLEVVYCDDCGAKMISYPGETGLQRDLFHAYPEGSNICQICNYENTCAHTDTYEDNMHINRRDYVCLSPTTHSYVFDHVHNVICRACGEKVGEIDLGKDKTTEEKHRFDGKVCSKCGYVDDCEHPNAFWLEEMYNQQITNINDTQHFYVYDRSNVFYCPACETALMRELLTSGVEGQEPHMYDAGVCYVCGHEKSACKHEHTATDVRIDNARDFAYLDAEWHTHVYDNVEKTYCLTCYETLSATVVEANLTRNQRHSYNTLTGICDACGYANVCSHANTKTEYNYGAEAYDPINFQSHSYLRSTIEHVVCLDCHATLSRSDNPVEEYVTEWHHFYNGICQNCHVEPMCAHYQVVRLYESANKRDVVFLDRARHSYTADERGVFHCMTCGENLAVIEDGGTVQRAENHGFVNGTCAACGYTDLEAVVTAIHQNAERNGAKRVSVKLRGDQNLLREYEYSRLQKLEEHERIAVVLSAVGGMNMVKAGVASGLAGLSEEAASQVDKLQKLLDQGWQLNSRQLEKYITTADQQLIFELLITIDNQKSYERFGLVMGDTWQLIRLPNAQ